MAEGYEDIEKLTTNQNQMLDNALTQQKDIINKQTELNVAELEKNKQEIDKEADKTNKALYTEYRKANNPYGSIAENLASQGLGNSGYAETTQTNLYNTYQKNITDTLNNARELKADFDFKINQARQTGDITLAQSALEIYNQKMQLLTQEYELKNNREQYLYQKEQDALAQNNWEKEFAYQQERAQASDNQWQQSFDYNKVRDEISDNQWQQSFDYNKERDQVSDNQWQQSFDYNKNRDNIADSQWQQSFDYQKQRDNVSDSQWAKEYELSKKASASKSSSNSNQYNVLNEIDMSDNASQENQTISETKKYTAEDIMKNVKVLSGPGNAGVRDGISGKIFDSLDELLNYYGFALAE